MDTKGNCLYHHRFSLTRGRKSQPHGGVNMEKDEEGWGGNSGTAGHPGDGRNVRKLRSGVTVMIKKQQSWKPSNTPSTFPPMRQVIE